VIITKSAYIFIKLVTFGMQSLQGDIDDSECKDKKAKEALASAEPKAVYSVRKAIPSYKGPIFRVRYVFKDATEEIFDEGGVLRTNTGTPLACLSKPNVYMVDTWYDQSPNALHAVQKDKAKQPYLVLKENTGYVVDFKYCRYLNIPDGTVPCGAEPYSVIFKHWDIANPIGGVLGSGNYECHSACNAIRRNGNGYVNYFWSNDMHTTGGSYKPGNVVAFIFSSEKKHVASVNGEINATRENVNRFSSPANNTIGKTYGENEYLNGELEYVYITEEISRRHVSLTTGAWSESSAF